MAEGPEAERRTPMPKCGSRMSQLDLRSITLGPNPYVIGIHDSRGVEGQLPIHIYVYTVSGRLQPRWRCDPKVLHEIHVLLAPSSSYLDLGTEVSSRCL
jgi:hypothetical protein